MIAYRIKIILNKLNEDFCRKETALGGMAEGGGAVVSGKCHYH